MCFVWDKETAFLLVLMLLGLAMVAAGVYMLVSQPASPPPKPVLA